MGERIHGSRRRFLQGAATIVATAPFGGLAAGAEAGDARELAAIGRAAEWLHSPRMTASHLLGKVVLVDFCTYTCINWLRTLPYRRAWAQKYGRHGLVLIGVHTPEFQFERNVDNVRRAVGQMGVEYPMVIDNDYAIWRAFENQYWPALYLVDGRGRVRHHQFGEGEFERSEMAIQRFLGEAGLGGPDGVVSVDGSGIEAAADWGQLRSPETYVGYARSERFASPGGVVRDRPRLYAVPDRLAVNQWAFAGEWAIGREASVLNSPTGRLAYRFHARDLHLVMGPPPRGGPVRFRVTLDGQPPGPHHGGDVDAAGDGTAVDQRLYQLVRQTGPVQDRRFEIEFVNPGVETFAFTFG